MTRKILLYTLPLFLLTTAISAESSDPECNNACVAAWTTVAHLAYSATAGATLCVLSGCPFRGYEFDTMAGLFAYSSIGAGSVSLVSMLGYYGIAQSDATTSGFIVAYVSGLIVGGISGLIWGYSALTPPKGTKVSFEWRVSERLYEYGHKSQNGQVAISVQYSLD